LVNSLIDNNQPGSNSLSEEKFQLIGSFKLSIFFMNIRLGQGFVVFILFFGIALLDAIHHFDWLKTLFWLGTGLIFIIADNLKKPGKKIS